MVRNAVVQPRKEKARRGEVNRMEIYQKRDVWYIKEKGKDLRTFSSKQEAEIAAGWVPPVEEILDGSKEEEESSEEKTSTDEQAPVLSSKGTSKEKV